VSTPVAGEVIIAWITPVEKACGTSDCCTVTGIAPISSASRPVTGLKARNLTPLKSAVDLTSLPA
jgi:hypothetical protein